MPLIGGGAFVKEAGRKASTRRNRKGSEAARTKAAPGLRVIWGVNLDFDLPRRRATSLHQSTTLLRLPVPPRPLPRLGSQFCTSGRSEHDTC